MDECRPGTTVVRKFRLALQTSAHLCVSQCSTTHKPNNDAQPKVTFDFPMLKALSRIHTKSSWFDLVCSGFFRFSWGAYTKPGRARQHSNFLSSVNFPSFCQLLRFSCGLLEGNQIGAFLVAGLLDQAVASILYHRLAT